MNWTITILTTNNELNKWARKKCKVKRLRMFYFRISGFSCLTCQLQIFCIFSLQNYELPPNRSYFTALFTQQLMMVWTVTYASSRRMSYFDDCEATCNQSLNLIQGSQTKELTRAFGSPVRHTAMTAVPTTRSTLLNRSSSNCARLPGEPCRQPTEHRAHLY